MKIWRKNIPEQGTTSSMTDRRVSSAETKNREHGWRVLWKKERRVWGCSQRLESAESWGIVGRLNLILLATGDFGEVKCSIIEDRHVQGVPEQTASYLHPILSADSHTWLQKISSRNLAQALNLFIGGEKLLSQFWDIGTVIIKPGIILF